MKENPDKEVDGLVREVNFFENGRYGNTIRLIYYTLLHCSVAPGLCRHIVGTILRQLGIKANRLPGKDKTTNYLTELAQKDPRELGIWMDAMREAAPLQGKFEGKFDAEMKEKTRMHRLLTPQKAAEAAAVKVSNIVKILEKTEDVVLIDADDGFDTLTLAELRQQMVCWQNRARYVPAAFPNRVLSEPWRDFLSAKKEGFTLGAPVPQYAQEAHELEKGRYRDALRAVVMHRHERMSKEMKSALGKLCLAPEKVWAKPR